jgi:hypothetical protein
MRLAASLLVAAGLVLSGLPHVFCACGCGGPHGGEARAAEPEPSCPGCAREDRPKPAESPEPCECPGCELVVAAVWPAPKSLPAPSSSAAWQEVSSAPVGVVVSSPKAAETGLPRDVGPPGRSSRPSAALPILLGHLLF